MSIGSGGWVHFGDWNTLHVRWSLDGKSDTVGRVLEEWRRDSGAKFIRGKEYTVKTCQGNEVLVLRIDFVLAENGVDPGSLVVG